MTPGRLTEIKRLTETEDDPGSTTLALALRDAVHEIEDLQKRIKTLEDEARDRALERDLTE